MTLADQRRKIALAALTPPRRRPFVFQTQTGVEEVALEGDAVIRGRWQDYPNTLRIDPNPKLVEEFPNWPTAPRDILRFTELYGPLDDSFEPGGTFKFLVEEWRELQREYQQLWRAKKPKGRSAIIFPHAELPAATGEQFEFEWDNLAYRTATLYRLLKLELHSRPRELLRICLRPDCPNPYFVASRGSRRYCSEPCAQWAQLRWKRDWWNKEGVKQRQAERKRAKKDKPR